MATTKPFLNENVNYFRERRDAWAFMYACDDAGIKAGFPEQQKNGRYAVRWIRPLTIKTTR